MKKKFAKKRERAAMGEDVNQNAVETKPKRAFVKPQDWDGRSWTLDTFKDFDFLYMLTERVQLLRADWMSYILVLWPV